VKGFWRGGVECCRQRHDITTTRRTNFGCLNIRSLNNKLDDVLEVRRDLCIDVLFLVETWHDPDAVCIRRLRADGFHVVDAPRPRAACDTVATNHGGVAVVAFTGARLQPLDIGAKPTTFEFVCVRVTSGDASYIVCAIYGPGSTTVSTTFFADLSDVFDRLATFVEPLFVVGDLNVHLDQTNDTSASQLVDLFADYGLACRVTVPTHDFGVLLDIVASRDDLPPPYVDVIDVGLSDHRLLRWPVSMSRPAPVYTTTVVRPWCQLDASAFRGGLSSSLLCQPESWSNYDLDGLACLYDSEIGAILDRLVPQWTVTCRRRPSDPWFDDECRKAKRSVRRLERASSRASRAAAADQTAVKFATAASATACWIAESRAYRDLLCQKRESFWQAKVESERSAPNVCGSQLTTSWAADACRRQRLSTHKNCIVFSMRRSPESVTRQPTLHRRASRLHRLAATSRRSASSLSTTSPPLSASYLTNIAPPIRFPRAF